MFFSFVKREKTLLLLKQATEDKQLSSTDKRAQVLGMVRL